MEKIKMPVPIAELDGDEMTHILWGMIKEQLICPFVELNTEYYDLSLPNRDRTEDAVTHQAAEAIRRLHVGVKCATITPNNPRGARRHGVPHANSYLADKAGCCLLGKAHYHCPSRVRRCVQGRGIPRSLRRQGRACVHRLARHGAEPPDGI